MYNLPYFKEASQQVISEFIAKNPFAFICGCSADCHPVATQIPVFLEEEAGKKFLRGHIMKHTDHHRAFLENKNVLVVFTGPHTYVSATWYSDPHQASTWNYMSVHARGEIKFLDDDALAGVLRKTTLHFENHNAASSTVFDNLPPDYREKLMKAIVAFEVEVKEMENVFKLSQNRDPQSYENIKARLQEGDAGAQMIAAEMQQRTKQLFPDDREWTSEQFKS